jgi:hypothetical protein
MNDQPEPVETKEKIDTIVLDAEDLRVYRKYLPDIERGARAKEIVYDYFAAIVRRSGFNSTRNWELVGRNIVIKSDPERAS